MQVLIAYGLALPAWIIVPMATFGSTVGLGGVLALPSIVNAVQPAGAL